MGMGRRLAESLPAARQLYDRAAEVLGYDLAKLCFEGPADELDSTVYSQPAIFVTSLAALESLRAESPDVVLACEATAGLSLGEYTAMVFAGVMEFRGRPDGRAAARGGHARGRRCHARRHGEHPGLERVEVEALCEKARNGEMLKIANLLCPGNIVISGSLAACERAAEMAQSARRDEGGAAGRSWGLSYRNHAPGRPAVRRGPGRRCRCESRAFPVISNVDALPHDDPEEIRRILVRQILQPVRWEDSMRYLIQQGFDQFYEVGPGRVLRGLLRRIDRNVIVPVRGSVAKNRVAA